MRMLALSLLLATTAIAVAAADTSWRDDAPGAVHRIMLSQMPRPFATHDAARPPEVVARPAGAVLRVPGGFVVTLFAHGLDMPRTLRRAPDGSVFLAESGSGRVLRFAVDGRRSVFAAGLDQPYGLAFWPPQAPRFLYVGESGTIVRYAWRDGADVAAGPAEPVVRGMPEGGHWTRDLAVAPDGSRLFVAIGSGSNDAEGMDEVPPGGVAAWQAAHGLGAAWDRDTGRAGVFWFRPDGADGLHPYAQGLRNCAGMAVQQATGALWCVTNERDGLGDNLPPDYATPVQEGAFYGWPWFYVGAHQDPRHRGQRTDLAQLVTVPAVPIQAHSAPLGIAFYDGSAFPVPYRGDAFVTLHGSWNRSLRTGYKVVRLRMDRNGHSDGAYQDFLTGFVVSDSAVWGRPVGVAVAGDGALLISDDAGGTIWRVAPAAP
jgi:glucose/arabinose dehydrogenase